jgi:hypothetical protein
MGYETMIFKSSQQADRLMLSPAELRQRYTRHGSKILVFVIGYCCSCVRAQLSNFCIRLRHLFAGKERTKILCLKRRSQCFDDIIRILFKIMPAVWQSHFRSVPSEC